MLNFEWVYITKNTHKYLIKVLTSKMLDHLKIIDSTLIGSQGLKNIVNYIYRYKKPLYPKPGTFYWVEEPIADDKTVMKGIYYTDSDGKLYRLDYEEELNERVGGVQSEISDKIEDAILYKPEDEYLSNAIGDIPSNLKKSDPLFSNQSFSKIFDKIIFPTVQPSVLEEPSTSMTYNNSSDDEIVVLKVGSKILSSQFGGTQSTGSVGWIYNDGVITNLGDYAGKPTITTTISPGNFDSVLSERSYIVTRKVTFADGVEYKTNKGGTSNLPPYKESSISDTKEFHVVAPIYCNTEDIKSIIEQDIVDYIGKDGEVIVDIPKETESDKFQIMIPSHLEFEVKQFNPISETYGPTIKMVQLTGEVKVSGVTYNRYTRTNDKNSIQSESRYKIIIKKVEK